MSLTAVAGPIACSPGESDYRAMIEICLAQDRFEDAYRLALAALRSDPGSRELRERAASLRAKRDAAVAEKAPLPGSPFDSERILRRFVEASRADLEEIEREYLTAPRFPAAEGDIFPLVVNMEPGMMGVVFVTVEDYRRLLSEISPLTHDWLVGQNPYLTQGVLLGWQGRFEEALELFRMALSLHEGCARTLNNMGVAYFRMGRLDEARERFEESLRTDGTNVFALNSLGRIALELGQTDAASRFFRRVLHLRPGNLTAHLMLGYLNFRQGDYEQAHGYYQRAHALDNRSAEACFGLGTVMAQKGRWSEAAAWLERAIASDQAHLEAYVALGGAYGKLEEYDKAKGVLGRALELEPDLPGAYYNLACVHAALQDPSRAVSYLEKALEKGFTEKILLRDAPELDYIRDDPDFRELLERLSV